MGLYAQFNFSRPEDYASQTVNALEGETSDPGVEAVTKATERALASAGSLRTWINWVLEGRHGKDPLELSIPTPEEEYGVGGKDAPHKHKCLAGDPVSCATGNEVETETDLTAGGRGLGLDLVRTYNSQLAAHEASPGPFGYGWTGSYSAHMEVNEELGLATVYADDGSTVRFVRSGESWSPPGPLVQATLAKEGSGYLFTLPEQTVLHFNSAGELTSEADRDGNTLTMSRGGEGRLEAIGDAAGRKITLAYDSEGQVESARDPMGHVVKYTYEGGNLASVTEPGETSPTWRLKYNSSHELTTLTDGRGHSVTTEYDGSDRVVSQTDALEHKRTWEYQGTFGRENTATVVTEPSGAVTREQFNIYGLVTGVTRAYGTALAATTTYGYSEANDLVNVTNPDGATTAYTYDAAGDTTSETNPDGDRTEWSYDATHDITSTTTPSGETTTIKRDGHGNPEVVERPAPGGKTQITRYKYDSHGDLESVTDPLERTWAYEYDSYGDRKSETDPEGNKRTWEYNEDSQEIATVSPRGNVTGGKPSEFTTKIERDARGRTLTVTDPLGHKTKYAYDGDGNLETQTDPNGNKAKYTFDADNEQTKVEEPSKAITETGYDVAGQVTSQIDGAKHATKYVRNLLEEVTEVVDPKERKTIKEYDLAGNLVKLTDAAKRTTTYTFDPAGRLKEVGYSDGKTHAGEFEYGKDGEVTQMKDGSGTTKYTYDQLGRLTETENGHKEAVKYEYDLAGHQSKITYPGGKAVVREYDKDGRLEKVTDWLSHTTKFSYNPDSGLKTTVFPSETKDEDKYSYNQAGLMSEVKMTKSSETLASLVYTRDSDGQVKTITSQGLPGEEKPAYEYDKNDRLTKGAGVAYEYDAANNPTKLGTSTYKYDSADELETATGFTYAYNEVGQRTKTTPTAGPATTYGYDQAGNLISIERPKEGEVSKIEDTYAYNAEGLRASQTISGTTTYLTWDINDELPLLLSDGTNSYIYGPSDTPIEQINTSTGTVSYLHHDQAGSTRLLTGSTGKVEGTFTYGPYGELTGSTGTATTPLGYDGQYTNSDTGLIYLRAREYDPKTAQFLSVDPLVWLTRAPYTYAGDNPLNFGDPTGRAFQICVGGTVSLGFFSVEGNVCYVNTPHGEGVAISGGASRGPGLGANVHLGAGGSNAQTPEEYGGPFANVGGSAQAGFGGYAGAFFGPGGSCTPVVAGGTAGVSAGIGAEAGAGASYTEVIPF